MTPPSNPHPFARFPVIVGPTAGGKSSLAVAVAHALARVGVAAEIVTADSVQVYRGLDIGSAKPTPAQQEGIPHHLIDIIDPNPAQGSPFTVVDWLREAEQAIESIRSRGRAPIVVGGTHLYIKTFLEGMFDGPGTDESLREELRAMGLAVLRAELEKADPAAAARIHPNDERRTVRALEVFRLTGVPISTHQSQWDQNIARPGCVLVGLDWPSEALNPRINARVRAMVDAGLVDEVRSLHAAGALGPQAREALGYKQVLAHLQGRCTLDEAIEAIKIETRRFGKNQRTWLRRLRTTPGSVWINAATTPEADWPAIVLEAMNKPA